MLVLIYNVTRFVSKNCNMPVLRIVVYVICQMHVIFMIYVLIYTFSLCVVNLEYTRVK